MARFERLVFHAKETWWMYQIFSKFFEMKRCMKLYHGRQCVVRPLTIATLHGYVRIWKSSDLCFIMISQFRLSQDFSL